MGKKKKYYVVWDGKETGIFDSWAECQEQIKGWPNAKYKSFRSREEAEAAWNGYAADFIGEEKRPQAVVDTNHPDIEWNSISVDAACSGNPGDMEYRLVDTYTKDEIFRSRIYKKGTNNIGEFLALVHALAYLEKTGQSKEAIYSDSRTAISWVKNRRVRTKLERDQSNTVLFKHLERAVDWLKNHQYKTPIRKWDTKNWGEIPADFGRK